MRCRFHHGQDHNLFHSALCKELTDSLCIVFLWWLISLTVVLLQLKDKDAGLGFLKRGG